MNKKKLAILDLGTNTFHLLIAGINGTQSEILLKERFLVKIGKSGINKRTILLEAIQRAVKAIKEIKNILDKYEVHEVRCIATSAIRNATNRQQLIDKIFDHSGINVTIIDGLTEAEYIYYGIRQHIDLGNRPTLMMDVGGGSVEFIIGNSYNILWKQSFEIGAQRLFDTYHRHDPVSETDINRLNDFLNIELSLLKHSVAKFKPQYLIGSSGTFDTINEIYCQKHQPVDKPVTNGHPIQYFELIEILNDIISKTRTERKRIPGMSPLRVDMMSMSALLVKYIVTTFQIKEIKYSSSALKEGFLQVVLNENSVNELSA